MTASPPRFRYRIRLKSGEEFSLDAENVVAWVAGFGAALGEPEAMNTIDHAAEDVRRVQALQIGDARGWFTYLFPEPIPAEG